MKWKLLLLAIILLIMLLLLSATRNIGHARTNIDQLYTLYEPFRIFVRPGSMIGFASNVDRNLEVELYYKSEFVFSPAILDLNRATDTLFYLADTSLPGKVFPLFRDIRVIQSGRYRFSLKTSNK